MFKGLVSLGGGHHYKIILIALSIIYRVLFTVLLNSISVCLCITVVLCFFKALQESNKIIKKN